MHEQKRRRGYNKDFFESVYHGEQPWDIGRPQKEYIQLEQAGEIVGSVLDVGCGTGENALYLAAHGHEVWGIDFAPYCNPESTGESRSASSNGNISCIERIRAAHTGKNVRYRHRFRAVPHVER